MSEHICEEKIFKNVYTAHAQSVRNFIYYKSGEMQLAEDIMQDAFFKMWENCKKVSLEKAKSYVFTIANNLFLNTRRHDKVKLKFKAVPPSDKDVQDPQFIMETDEFKQKLEQAISNLPEDQRLVFLMNRIDKKKYREIAEELEVSIKTVEKRMHKALKSLRELYKNI